MSNTEPTQEKVPIIELDRITPQQLQENLERVVNPERTPENEPILGEPGNPKSVTGAEQTPILCTRCGWPVDKPFEVNLGPHDTEMFIASWLGNRRFERTFPLLGGKCEALFRTLTAQEYLLIEDHLTWMARLGKITTPTQWIAYAQDYRFLLSFHAVRLPDGATLRLPELHEWVLQNSWKRADGENTAPTPLDDFRQWVYQRVLVSEPLVIVLRRIFPQFQRLVEKLEEMCLDENFIGRIE